MKTLAGPKRAPAKRFATACSGYLEIFGGRLAAIGDELVLDLLAFVEATQPRALHRRNVHEHIFVARGRLDEAIALSRIKPFDGALLHRLSPGQFRCSIDAKWQPHACTCTPRHKPDFGGKSETIASPRQHRPEGQNPIASSGKRKNAAQPGL